MFQAAWVLAFGHFARRLNLASWLYCSLGVGEILGSRRKVSYSLEALKGDRSGQRSIRINDQWRVCFRWTEGGVENVEIVDYH